jgi:DNA-binding SARP family transcriptional activator
LEVLQTALADGHAKVQSETEAHHLGYSDTRNGFRPDGRTTADNVSVSAFSADRLVDSAELFERFPYGLVLTDRDGRILRLNRAARRLLVSADPEGSDANWTCCDLICSRLGPIIGGGCLSERVSASGAQVPEVRMDIEQDRLRTAAWVTASPLDPDGSQLIFHLRPGRPGDRRRRTPLEWASHAGPSHHSHLQIVTLGRFQVETAKSPMNGEWLDQRPGQLLKYLVCERRRVVTSDQIGEALWPDAGVSEARNRLRQYVHGLRDKLEPDRGHRSPARFLVARRGGYILDTDGVWIDADEFEREAQAGLLAFAQGLNEPAAAHLSTALRLYQDGFLAEEPYLDWALEERERLRELAGRALRAQVRIYVQLDRLEAAAAQARRLADMEPFDADVQKLFLDICLKRGRRSEAVRRYAFLRKRMLDSFGQEPDFELLDIERAIAKSEQPED